MRLRLSALLVCFACGATSVAWGEESDSGPNLEARSYGGTAMGMANGPFGLKLGEGSLLHASLGADIGYDSNVFYTQTPISATVAHVTPALDLSNGERDDAVLADTGGSVAVRSLFFGFGVRRVISGDDIDRAVFDSFH